MTLIAHLSDLHLLEHGVDRRSGRERWRLEFLSFGRALDADERRARFVGALVDALDARPDWIVVTGDLTEDGTTRQFEAVAEAFDEAGADVERVILVPGNHDAYREERTWERALEGPLRPFARTSALHAPVVADDVVFVPVSSAIRQSIALAAGFVSAEGLGAIDRACRDSAFRAHAVAAVLHHPPLGNPVSATNWIDGLHNPSSVRKLLHDNPALHALHGHTHRAAVRPVRPTAEPRLFSAPAVVDDPRPVRFYEALDRRLVPVEPTTRSSSGVHIVGESFAWIPPAALGRA